MVSVEKKCGTRDSLWQGDVNKCEGAEEAALDHTLDTELQPLGEKAEKNILSRGSSICYSGKKNMCEELGEGQ